MFFPGTPNIFVPGDSVFMLLKCMCNNKSIEKQKKKSEYNYNNMNEAIRPRASHNLIILESFSTLAALCMAC